ncbi:hypothetical protein [Nodularia sp. NIES-3585]|uniref:hypothetical protein n=1 Tax=Nodularia sp. NIES-3585 TaxID=1973477 RepID=UPI000B5CCB14|nr:hypothetical protein [Nodularia sp. NIES-3585]GAX37881.1 hypothetical protein NIES3585_39260 [Nodularia sp. NIES-3585]
MNKSALIATLARIAEKDSKLTHHEITVFAYGMLSVLPEVTDISPLVDDEVELFLKMLTKQGVPHHARRLQAEHCITLLRKEDDSKKWIELSPAESF